MKRYILTALVCMLVFSGCGSKTQPEGEKPETSAETVQQTTAPKKEPVDPTSAMLAFYREGKKIYGELQ